MAIRIFDGAEALSEAAAAHLLQLLSASTGSFDLCLSGGSTPKKLYTILASPAYRDDVPWSRVHFWFGDERFVPPTDPDSNERMAREAMLDHVPVPPENIHGMYQDSTAEEAAERYERELRAQLGDKGFDLLLLGLGPDAHTASLFPHDPSIDEKQKWVVASTGAAGVKQRLTLTPPVLNASKQVLFLVAGDDKAVPLANVLNGLEDVHQYPAQIVARNAKDVLWFLDDKAAAKL